MNKKGKLFVFSAPSGSGKTTILKKMLELYPELVFSISATTREKRFNEEHGKDYFYLSEKEFEEKIESGEFIEWSKHFDYYYGTLKSFVEKNINAGKSLILEVDVTGALNIKKSYPESVLIFISPPGVDELRKRLVKRNTETEEDLCKRIERAEMELGYKDQFNYVVVNEYLEKAVEETKEIFRKEIN